ncbi:hypothetical protein LIER_12494 [Lithospermum erythrorhizon]|uniref:Uncharacterized protein n=1 Tax=Lithospermum erythrorhizon TaxID=34254 RepID=A0AAV3PUE9_LITER
MSALRMFGEKGARPASSILVPRLTCSATLAETASTWRCKASIASVGGAEAAASRDMALWRLCFPSAGSFPLCIGGVWVCQFPTSSTSMGLSPLSWEICSMSCCMTLVMMVPVSPCSNPSISGRSQPPQVVSGLGHFEHGPNNPEWVLFLDRARGIRRWSVDSRPQWSNSGITHPKNKDKLSPKWEGPYRMSRRLGPGTYELKRMNGEAIPRTWHASNLAKY